MSRVIDDDKPMTVGNLLDRVHVTEVTVYVDRQNGAGVGRNERLKTGGVHGIVVGPYVSEDGRESLAHDRVGRGGKGEGRGDDLALELHGLKDALER